MTPPLWIIQQSVWPKGIRLPSLPEWKEPPPPAYSYDGRRFQGRQTEKKKNRDISLVTKHQFVCLNDLRFWTILENVHGIALCRACCKRVTTMEQMKAHDKGGCPGDLADAYRLLLKDSLCVLCDEKTSSRRWGVPLCEGCVDEWATVWEPTPKALRLALDLSKELNRG